MNAVSKIKSKKGASLFASFRLADENIANNNNFFKKAQETKVETPMAKDIPEPIEEVE